MMSDEEAFDALEDVMTTAAVDWWGRDAYRTAVELFWKYNLPLDSRGLLRRD